MPKPVHAWTGMPTWAHLSTLSEACPVTHTHTHTHMLSFPSDNCPISLMADVEQVVCSSVSYHPLRLILWNFASAFCTLWVLAQ